MRQFGSENITFKSEVESPNMVLSEAEIKDQVKQVGDLIVEAVVQTEERAIKEKAIFAKYAAQRREAVAKLDEALKTEMSTKKAAAETMREAERLSRKLENEKNKSNK